MVYYWVIHFPFLFFSLRSKMKRNRNHFAFFSLCFAKLIKHIFASFRFTFSIPVSFRYWETTKAPVATSLSPSITNSPSLTIHHQFTIHHHPSSSLIIPHPASPSLTITRHHSPSLTITHHHSPSLNSSHQHSPSLTIHDHP